MYKGRNGSVLVIVLFIVIVLLAVLGVWYYYGHRPSTSTGTSNSPAVSTSTVEQKPVDAVSFIVGLKKFLADSGYVTSTLSSSSPVGVPAFPWYQSDNTGLRITPTSMWLNTLAAGSDTNSIFSENAGNILPMDDPQVHKFIDGIGAYMSAQGFSPQQNASGTATWNYQSSDGIRCNLTLYDPNAGEYESFPYAYYVLSACADDSAYQSAVNTQEPILQALKSELNQKDSYGVAIADSYPTIINMSLCSGDSSMEAVEVAGGSAVNYFYVKKVDGSWIDAVGLNGATRQQASAACGRF